MLLLVVVLPLLLLSPGAPLDCFLRMRPPTITRDVNDDDDDVFVVVPSRSPDVLDVSPMEAVEDGRDVDEA